MKALLLNSGLGSRMGELTAEKPKCMCPIDAEHTILSAQLELLHRCGITDVVVTTGPFAEKLVNHAQEFGEGLRFTFISNPLYDKTNYIYSMLLAKEVLMDDDILLLHGDLVLEESVLRDLLAASGSAVAVDRTLPLPEKDFKARIDGGCVREIGVSIFGEDCKACQPAYKWKQSDFAQWMVQIELFCQNGVTNVYAENAFNTISERVHLCPMELSGRLCNEIDNLADLKIVSERRIRMKERGGPR